MGTNTNVIISNFTNSDQPNTSNNGNNDDTNSPKPDLEEKNIPKKDFVLKKIEKSFTEKLKTLKKIERKIDEKTDKLNKILNKTQDIMMRDRKNEKIFEKNNEKFEKN